MRALLPLLCLAMLAGVSSARASEDHLIPPLPTSPAPPEAPASVPLGVPRLPAFPPAPVFPSLAPAFRPAAESSKGPDSILVLPEVTTQVELSNRDVNWLRCNGEITEVVTSQEKNVEVRYSGSNAFVKFKALKLGDELLFSGQPTELYAVCEGEVYKMIANPRDLPAVTVRLGSPVGDAVAKNREHLSSLPWERKLVTLVHELYTGNIPPTYRPLSVPQGPVPFSSAATLEFVRGYAVEGEGLAVYELRLTCGEAPLRLDEQALLRRALPVQGTKAAIALERHGLSPREVTRAFVVTRQQANAPATPDSLLGDLVK